jgi:hydrogenase expression/formation protein HypC
MCLALPAQVVALHDNDTATVSLGGLRQIISLSLVDGIAIGDFVIVHTGFALSRLDPEEAARTLALLRETGIARQNDADDAPLDVTIAPGAAS